VTEVLRGDSRAEVKGTTTNEPGIDATVVAQLDRGESV
jgi:hypothetical protein